ncbi:MAG: glycosyltransferase family 2 protein, partial [Acidaminobacteraceae bacterium]
MKWIDSLFLFSMISIWILLVTNIILLFFGYTFSEDMQKRKLKKIKELSHYPMISIMIPSHNEEVVIYKTLLAMIKMNYPNDRYEIIVINDNSKDKTGEIIERVKSENPASLINHVEVIGDRGGKGKSNALNIGFQEANGEFLVIYDADNTPNAMALKYLLDEIMSNDNYGAVIGKFRTRNKNKNLLTKFINIETLSFQWMAQAGRWKLFKLCTIPGTNFIIRRSIIEKIGGWDTEAVAEDTEISFRIYEMGYKIAFMPLAETFEQEPETIKVWMKQRSRWVN